MSLKNDKYIESAQKLIIKGQFEKAAIDLEQAVAFDPGDLKVRQRLAEILIRINRQKDAISHYETIGTSFADGGFYLKAIAVYKQIQKLDPENAIITLTLAELNVNHGLIGNALAEFSLVVNQHLKSGRQPEAIQLLERMLEIDPSNLNTMLKIAETLLATGNAEAAYERYLQLARQLWDRPEKTPFYRLSERIDTLFPNKGYAILMFIPSLIEQGKTGEAFANLKAILSRSPEIMDAWYLMADTIRAVGDKRQLRLVLEKISERYPLEIRAKEELLTLAVSTKDADYALELLKEFMPLLVEKGRADYLEKIYKALQLLAPDDERPLEGLNRLYEATGYEIKQKVHFIPDETEPVQEQSVSTQELEEECVTSETDSLQAPKAIEIQEHTSCGMEPSDWEEDVELELDEEPAQETLTPQISSEIPSVAVADQISFDAEEAELIGSEEELSRRVILTIENPLPVESFLPGEPHEELGPETEPEQSSPWDEISDEVHSSDKSAGYSAPPSLHTAEDLVDLLVESIESGADASRGEGSGQDLPKTGELEIELIAEHDEEWDFAGEAAFELEDLSSFAEGLFATESTADSESPDSDEYSFGNMLSAFKKGVDEQLDAEDTESHYNLGIAYKEMGLYDEAIHEFRNAGHDPKRAADCMTLQGICLKEKGDIEAAESILREALCLPDLAIEVLLNLKYELANLLEQANRPEDAVELYKEIIQVIPSYRDASLNVSRLSNDEDLDLLIELKEED